MRVLGGFTYTDSELLDTDGGANDGNRSVGVPKFRGVLGGTFGGLSSSNPRTFKLSTSFEF